MGRRLRVKKETTLSRLFVRYLFRFGGMVVAIIMALAISFLVLGWCNVIYPAYYAQDQAKKASTILREKEEFLKEDVPELCTYVVFRPDGEVLSTDISNKQTKDIWKILQGEYANRNGYYFEVIEKEDWTCVLRYRMMPEWRSNFLRTYLINPQNLLLVIATLLVLASLLLFAILFGKRISKEMNSILDVTTKVQNQELDFEVKKGKVKEINHILSALDEMRNQLQASLQKQWLDTEQRKKQISALAHDLKTPITIIKGNVDIMEDTILDEEQRDCLNYINGSINQMQEYVGLLIDVNRSKELMKPKKKEILLSNLVEEIHTQAKGLCQNQEVSCDIQVHTKCQSFVGDENLIVRAIMNVISNAIDFSPKAGEVEVQIESDEKSLHFIVLDSGPGFSKEGLQHATSQFYMEDFSRNAKSHYGIGLYMASNVAQLHGGELKLENRETDPGAKVTISIDRNDSMQ